MPELITSCAPGERFFPYSIISYIDSFQHGALLEFYPERALRRVELRRICRRLLLGVQQQGPV